MGVLVLGASGTFYRAYSIEHPLLPLSLPSGVTLKDGPPRPSFVRYRTNSPNPNYGDGLTNSYISAMWDKMLVVTYSGDLVKAGIDAPAAAPTLVEGAGSTGLTGAVIACFTWAHYSGGVLIHEGNPSPKTATINFTHGGAADISGVPATAPDTRTTHWHLYLSVNGSLSYRAAVVAIGATTASVTTTFAALASAGITLPIMFDDDGNPADDVLARGVPPYATRSLVWKNRQWLISPTGAGVHYSFLFEMESFNTDTDHSFIPTTGGEYPIAIFGLDDELVIFTESIIYSLSGSGESTFRLRKVSEDVRLIAPAAVVVINGILFFPSDQGICAYFGGGGGGVKNLMAESWRKYWISLYEANRVAYENGCAANDMRFGDYVFVPDTSTTRTIRGFYRPMTERGEGEPWWYFGDVRDRRLKTVSHGFIGNSHMGLFVYGECNGKVYVDDDDDGDDDSDSYNKRCRIMHKHLFFGDQGGDDAHGRTYTNSVWYGKQNNQTITVKLYCGDDTANEGTQTFSGEIAPLQNVPGQTTQATSRSLPLQETSGKGVTLEIAVDNWIGGTHRGFAILTREGPQSRA